MNDAYIVDAIRTPTGRKGGGLSEVHPADLGACHKFPFRAKCCRPCPS